MSKANKLNQEELERIKDNLMYDFPKHYDNYHIMAYQKGLNKLASAILSAGYVKLEDVEYCKYTSITKLIEIFKHDQKLNVALNDYYDGRISKSIVYNRLAHAITSAKDIVKVKGER